ncbi:MAG: DUF262 domain-containing protein [Erysipelothrix sp.]
MNNLAAEIKEQSSQIYRDAYQMSIGELINIYKDNEMEIHPEFQRVYRWTETQKTRLIESILLNIPIPSIFVNQDDTGVWDIIDGVQRLSTIFQFVGVLKDDEGELVQPLVLEKTKYLPSLEGYVWETGEEGEKIFSPEQRMDFKRARIDVVIVRKESDSKTKYELFQRLNTGGTQLSEQEVRNCLIIMTNRDFYEKIIRLDMEEAYISTTTLLTDRKIEEQYRKELLIRLIVACEINWSTKFDYTDLSDLLDQEIIKISESEEFIFVEFNAKFDKTFRIIDEAFGEDAFRKYDRDKNKFSGALLSGAYQAITCGIFMNLEFVEAKDQEWLIDKVQNMYYEEDYNTNMATGVRPITRYKNLSIFGMRYFSF